MTTTSTARIANDSAFREAQVAMDKFIEQLMAMADQGATADAVSQLLAKDGTALLRDLRVSQGLDQNAATPVEKAAGYLVKHTRLLHYDRALADGLPIATGVIEGACRYLVQDRMGRTGARWSLTGAEAILSLRALRTSGDFDDYWLFHLERERTSARMSHATPTALHPTRCR